MSLESVQVPGVATAEDDRVPVEEIRPGGGRLAYPPAMEVRFRPALAALFDEMHARDDVTALLCFGSAQRGESRPGSDLDLFVVTSGDQQWLQSRMVEGVEVQVKMSPPRGFRAQMDRQNPAILGAFATGVLLFDRAGEATELKRFAEERFRAGPQAPNAADVEGGRYSLTNKVRDLEDMHQDNVVSRMLSGMTVVESIRIWSVFQSVWRTKKPAVMLENIQTRDPALAEKIERYYDAPSTERAIAVADAVLDAMGGRLYEISTPPKST